MSPMPTKGTVTIRNARVVLPGGIQQVDVLVKAGIISAIGRNLPGQSEVFDAYGLVLMPGIIDPQVHFRDPGAPQKEDLHSGSCAAAAGGVTSFLDMPNNSPPVIDRIRLAVKKEDAAKKCVVNYGFFIGATPDNLEELNSAENVCGIKIFMGSSTGNLLVSEDSDLERIFSTGTRLIAVHAEDESLLQENSEMLSTVREVEAHPRIRDEAVALRASEKAVALSLKYQRRLHILHLTTEEEVRMLQRLPRGHKISTEVCTQHLTLIAPGCYRELGTLAQMNPPLRTSRHRDSLWKALKDGVIDCIATDHAPHTLEEKKRPYGEAPSGMPGVETSLPLMLDRANRGECSLLEISKWMSEAPARLYGMFNKGRIEVGYDADLVLVDMEQTKTVTNGQLHTRVNWSPFHGMQLKGWPVRTLVHGKTVFLDGKVDTKVRGREIRFA